jgi:phospholipid/cholesterol/gamma-HCH transport system substrate-binding protein
MEERFKFRHVNEITGTFVLLILALLIAAVVWTGRSQRWFKSSVTLRISLPETGAAGIREGSEVYFLGTLVGSVSDVIVDTTGRMEAQAKIRRDFFRFVRADSSAVVKRKFGVAGDSFFEISRGHGNPLPEEEALIICNEQYQSELEAAVDEIRTQALLVLKKSGAGLDTWTKLGADMGESRQHLDQIIVRLDGLAADLEQGKGAAGRLITDTAMADQAQQLLARAGEALSGLEDAVTNVNLAAENVRNGTARLPEITDAVADETKDLPGLVKQTQTSMREMERLMEAMQRTWLVRKYVNRTNPPPTRPISEPAVQEMPSVKSTASPRASAR